MIMKSTFKILSNQEYKRTYFPYLEEEILSNSNALQVYEIERYLKGILIPALSYRTSFSFLIIVTHGSVKQCINNEIHTISQGECAHISEGVWTDTQFVSEDVSGYVLAYESNIYTQYSLFQGKQVEFNYTPFYKLSPYDFEATIASLNLLKNELNLPQSRANVYLPLFYSILSRLNTYAQENTVSGREVEIVHYFKKLVNQFHIENRAVSFYAEKLHLSENYLNRCVKHITSKSAKQWINEVSIEHSQLLLRDLTLDIAEIAYAMRYPSPSYFSKIFKKIRGISPISYRHSLFS